jgi:hypothetical protein
MKRTFSNPRGDENGGICAHKLIFRRTILATKEQQEHHHEVIAGISVARTP